MGKKSRRNRIKKKNVVLVPPADNLTSKYRAETAEFFKNIKEPHCVICGDTVKDSTLFQIQDKYLCEFCYNVQMSM